MQTLRTGAETDLLAVVSSSRSILGFNLVSMHTKSFDATLKLFGATIMATPFFSSLRIFNVQHSLSILVMTCKSV